MDVWCPQCSGPLSAAYATVPKRLRAALGMEWRNMKRIGSWCWACLTLDEVEDHGLPQQ